MVGGPIEQLKGLRDDHKRDDGGLPVCEEGETFHDERTDTSANVNRLNATIALLSLCGSDAGSSGFDNPNQPGDGYHNGGQAQEEVLCRLLPELNEYACGEDGSSYEDDEPQVCKFFHRGHCQSEVVKVTSVGDNTIGEKPEATRALQQGAEGGRAIDNLLTSVLEFPLDRVSSVDVNRPHFRLNGSADVPGGAGALQQGAELPRVVGNAVAVSQVLDNDIISDEKFKEIMSASLSCEDRDEQRREAVEVLPPMIPVIAKAQQAEEKAGEAVKAEAVAGRT